MTGMPPDSGAKADTDEDALIAALVEPDALIPETSEETGAAKPKIKGKTREKKKPLEPPTRPRTKRPTKEDRRKADAADEDDAPDAEGGADGDAPERTLTGLQRIILERAVKSTVSDNQTDARKAMLIADLMAKCPARLVATLRAKAAKSKPKSKGPKRAKGQPVPRARTVTTTRRRRRPGTVALMEIRVMQKRTTSILPYSPVREVVREIVFIVGKPEFRISPIAIKALREAAETYLTSLFEDANVAAIHSRRITIMVKDIHLVLRIRNNPFERKSILRNSSDILSAAPAPRRVAPKLRARHRA